MSAHVSPLLTDLSLRRPSDPYADDLLTRWENQTNPGILQSARESLPELWNNPPSGVNDALRWALYKGRVSSVSNVGAVLHPQGLLLTCQSTIITSSDRVIVPHMPLAVAAGPKLLGFLPLPPDDLARRLIEHWSPNYRPLDPAKLHGSITRMLGVKEPNQVRGVPNATLKTKLIKPVADYLPFGEVRDFWSRLPAPDALSIMWELPKPIEATITISKPAPLDELHCALLSWAGSFGSFVLGAPFPKRAPVLDVVSINTAAAAYEASLVLLDLCRNSETS